MERVEAEKNTVCAVECEDSSCKLAKDTDQSGKSDEFESTNENPPQGCREAEQEGAVTVQSKKDQWQKAASVYFYQIKQAYWKFDGVKKRCDLFVSSAEFFMVYFNSI